MGALLLLAAEDKTGKIAIYPLADPRQLPGLI